MDTTIAQRIADATGSAVDQAGSLGGGHGARLYGIVLADGRELVAKAATTSTTLDLEGTMLRYLAEHSRLPVPEVFLAEADLLVMSRLANRGRMGAAAQAHAAELLADLHGVTGPEYGFQHATLIGPLHQPNPPGDDWIAFFRDHRLLHMARKALTEGEIGNRLMHRIERLAERLGELIGPAAPATLIHGDMWGGNVLVDGDSISGFIDPAIYYADPEIELAFSTLFGTFGEPFFRRYAELRPIRPGFFELRADLYNLYPLLVHVRIFGSSYVGAVERIVSRHVP